MQGIDGSDIVRNGNSSLQTALGKLNVLDSEPGKISTENTRIFVAVTLRQRNAEQSYTSEVVKFSFDVSEQPYMLDSELKFVANNEHDQHLLHTQICPKCYKRISSYRTASHTMNCTVNSDMFDKNLILRKAVQEWLQVVRSEEKRKSFLVLILNKKLFCLLHQPIELLETGRQK